MLDNIWSLESAIFNKISQILYHKSDAFGKNPFRSNSGSDFFKSQCVRFGGNLHAGQKNTI